MKRFSAFSGLYFAGVDMRFSRGFAVAALVAIALVLGVFLDAGEVEDQSGVVGAKWTGDWVIPLVSVDAHEENDDLLPLRSWIGDAQIVGLGEGNHGISEFFRLKHRVARHLFEEGGFTVFALEANLPECERINEWVLGGEGDPRELLAALDEWIWNIEEYLDLITWMREFNRERVRKVKFAGFDMKRPVLAMDNVVSGLRGINPETATTAAAFYAPFRDIPGMGIIPFKGGGLYTDLPEEFLRLAAGRQITLSGWIKTEGVDRFASHGAGPGLWLRAGREFGHAPWAPGKKPPGTSPWQRYSVEIQVPQTANSLRFGVVHYGNGRVWFDGLEFAIDGQPVEMPGLDVDFETESPFGFQEYEAQFAPIQVVDYSFESDNENVRSGKKSLRIVYNPLLDKAVANAAEVLEYLTRFQDSYAERVGDARFEWVMQNARIVHQALSWRADHRLREKWMAENIRWLHEHGFPGEKIALSAANLHVCNCGSGGRFRRTGSYLKEWYGTEYVTTGLFAFTGTYRDWDYKKMIKGAAVVPLPGRNAESLEICLEQAGLPIMMVDVRNPDAAECLASVREQYDLLAFVREANPSRWLGEYQKSDSAP